ncbi:acetylornithine deacetylase [Methylovirgula sp. 4M-Z18]|uniref:acetylornithine deacetylase n=1 Tax=Methylovirgula sp. 4M-Z18 TaxID=2293567 RepID=UPI000E2E9012|nr:acetylornithine deacetylase [Methylovirgula sp. 4M-Z18]RFB78603.1 acetylornithine deacetylase [Methylovirgula sp. 4M-Z18]
MQAAPPDRLAKAVALLEHLIAFDTESSKTNLPLIAFVETYLRDLGVPFMVVPNDKGDKAALFATIGPMVDDGIVLSGHTDVVPVEGQEWTTDPFQLRRDKDRLYGRGSVDMKGFAAVALAMAPAFQQAALKRPIHILLSYDEETTCLGPVETIARFGKDLPRPRAVIVGEPTLMQVADSHKSISTYDTRVHGFEAHSAKPALGAHAIAAAADLVSELSRLQDKLEVMGDPSGRFDPPYATVHVGKIQGGTARNILAKECTFLWEFRGLPGMPANFALQHLRDYATRVALPKLRRFTMNASIETDVEVDIPCLTAEAGSVAETLALKLSQSNNTIAVPYATEGGRFQTAGIPTVVCGPGSIDQAHQPDEYIEVKEVEAGLKFMERLAEEMSV